MSKIKSFINDIASVFNEAPGLFVSIMLALFIVFAVGLVALGIGPDALVDTNDDEDSYIVENDTLDVFADTTVIADSEPPRLVDEDTEQQAVLSASIESQPVRIIISSVGIDTPIINPTSQDINVLNEALNSGAVRYPGSGNPEDITNMFIFGHSSHLPVVNNQAYKALNDLEDVLPGDIVRVQTESKEYHYRVTNVQLVSAENAWVEFASTKKKLTLSTCNNFGSKQDRFVVEAEWIGEFELSI